MPHVSLSPGLLCFINVKNGLGPVDKVKLKNESNTVTTDLDLTQSPLSSIHKAKIQFPATNSCDSSIPPAINFIRSE
ncbi:hypothetical protein H5410_017245 [Solanum commersonii]|uniref:Uncharacterized protein n=1 Tax=Solanum commersonii TaxID=4109 RepID=A0A9J5ZYL5_SOLCO|nr:hypothetical protein H5410_017245 [Solanum commersonii]